MRSKYTFWQSYKWVLVLLGTETRGKCKATVRKGVLPVKYVQKKFELYNKRHTKAFPLKSSDICDSASYRELFKENTKCLMRKVVPFIICMLFVLHNHNEALLGYQRVRDQTSAVISKEHFRGKAFVCCFEICNVSLLLRVTIMYRSHRHHSDSAFKPVCNQIRQRFKKIMFLLQLLN